MPTVSRAASAAARRLSDLDVCCYDDARSARVALVDGGDGNGDEQRREHEAEFGLREAHDREALHARTFSAPSAIGVFSSSVTYSSMHRVHLRELTLQRTGQAVAAAADGIGRAVRAAAELVQRVAQLFRRSRSTPSSMTAPAIASVRSVSSRRTPSHSPPAARPGPAAPQCSPSPATPAPQTPRRTPQTPPCCDGTARPARGAPAPATSAPAPGSCATARAAAGAPTARRLERRVRRDALLVDCAQDFAGHAACTAFTTFRQCPSRAAPPSRVMESPTPDAARVSDCVVVAVAWSSRSTDSSMRPPAAARSGRDDRQRRAQRSATAPVCPAPGAPAGRATTRSRPC
jgi:hypothetical protein